ncbi:MAG: ceramidase domain-containing protein [Candidatus Microsaccharimonas sp.]
MDSALFTPVDIYCERLGPSFWAEPLNAVTNASFLIAAWLAWRLIGHRRCGGALQARVLVTLVATIGIGSFLFHTVAVRWAALADVIPIFIYQSPFLVFYLHQVAKARPLFVVCWFLAFLAVSFGFGALPGRWLNGSLSYASALLFIAGLGIYHWKAGQHRPRFLIIASGVFIVSLVFRSIDMSVCDHLSIGTHLVWHLLNGVVLYLTTVAFIANLQPDTRGLSDEIES